jgi:cytochrome c oxidase subunit II
MNRRQALTRSAFALLGLVAAGTMVRRSMGAGNAKIVEITAQRFRFTPAEIALKSGEPVVFAITSLDFVHGFKVPDLGIRRDLLPGPATRIEIGALKAGRYEFLCDNFCGGGHEEMNGTIVVSD